MHVLGQLSQPAIVSTSTIRRKTYDMHVPSGFRMSVARTLGNPGHAIQWQALLFASSEYSWLQELEIVDKSGFSSNSQERCDLGVKMAAFAALGEMAAPRDEGVKEPLVLCWRGVKDGESTLKRFFMFSFWVAFAASCI
jgi:hypothetical protein